MKNVKWWLRWIVVGLTVSLGAMPSSALTETVDGVEWTYTVSDWTYVGTNKVKVAIVEKADPASGELVIPSTLGGNSVGSIDRSAFPGCSGLTSVFVPDSVSSVGTRAFENCDGLSIYPKIILALFPCFPHACRHKDKPQGEEHAANQNMGNLG